MKSKKSEPRPSGEKKTAKRRSPPPESFEEAFAVVEAAVDGLERGGLSLEESLREYEQGLRALRQCYEILGRAQKRIEVLGEEVGAVTEGSEGVEWKPARTVPSLGKALDLVERDRELPAAGGGDGSEDGGE